MRSRLVALCVVAALSAVPARAQTSAFTVAWDFVGDNVSLSGVQGYTTTGQINSSPIFPITATCTQKDPKTITCSAPFPSNSIKPGDTVTIIVTNDFGTAKGTTAPYAAGATPVAPSNIRIITLIIQGPGQ